MGKSAEDLRREIADTRSDLGETVDAIGDRVSPGRMMERRKNRVAQSVVSVRERVMGAAESAGDRMSDAPSDAIDAMRRKTEGSPLLAGALAFGAGMLVAAIVPATETEKEASHALMERAEPLTNAVTDTARDLAGSLKEPAREAAEEIKETAADAARSTADTAKQAAERARSQGGSSAPA